MKTEEKQLLLKDLCARLPYGVRVNIIEDAGGAEIDDELTTSTISHSFMWTVKPYLRPMSSMTEEEAKEIAILHDIKDILSVKVTSDYIDVIVDDGVCSTERRTIWYDEIVSSVKCFDFLTAHHFDYRGLIEKGLALEASKDMYKEK